MRIPSITRSRIVLGATLSLAVFLVVACGDGALFGPKAATPDDAQGERALVSAAQPGVAASAAAVNRDLAALRRATASFHRVSAAAEAGYEILVTHPVSGAACLEHPTLGGMGRHFLNLAHVSDQVAVTEPEVLIYEPQPNGRLRLVGVEYLIPFEIRGRDEPPPVLFGREFVQNETFDLWALHVWAWKHNPAGMFADWNPAVSCEFDERVDD